MKVIYFQLKSRSLDILWTSGTSLPQKSMITGTPFCFFNKTDQWQWTLGQKVHFTNVIKWLTSNSTHLLWWTDIVDYHLRCSSLCHWNKSPLDITRWEWSAYPLQIKNIDINWMKPCTRQVLAVEIFDDVDSYNVEITQVYSRERGADIASHILMTAEMISLPAQMFASQKSWHDKLSAEVNVEVFALWSEKLMVEFFPDRFLQIRNYCQWSNRDTVQAEEMAKRQTVSQTNFFKFFSMSRLWQNILLVRK